MRTILYLTFLQWRATLRSALRTPGRRVAVGLGLLGLPGAVAWFLLNRPQWSGLGGLWGVSSMAQWSGDAMAGFLLVYLGGPLVLTFLQSVKSAPFYLSPAECHWVALMPISPRALAFSRYLPGLLGSAGTALLVAPLVAGTRGQQPLWAVWLGIFSISLWVRSVAYLVYFRVARTRSKAGATHRSGPATGARAGGGGDSGTGAGRDTAADAAAGGIATVAAAAAGGPADLGLLSTALAALVSLPPLSWLAILFSGEVQAFGPAVAGVLALDLVAVTAVWHQAEEYLWDLLERSQQREIYYQLASQTNVDALMASFYRVSGGPPPLPELPSLLHGPLALAWATSVGRVRIWRYTWRSAAGGLAVMGTLIGWGLSRLVVAGRVAPEFLPVLAVSLSAFGGAHQAASALRQPYLFTLPGSAYRRLTAYALPAAVDTFAGLSVFWLIAAAFARVPGSLVLAGIGVCAGAAFVQCGHLAWVIGCSRHPLGRPYVVYPVTLSGFGLLGAPLLFAATGYGVPSAVAAMLVGMACFAGMAWVGSRHFARAEILG